MPQKQTPRDPHANNGLMVTSTGLATSADGTWLPAALTIADVLGGCSISSWSIRP